MAQRLVLGRLGAVNPVRQHAVANVVDALEVDAVRYRKLAYVVQVLQCDLGVVPVPPRPRRLLLGTEVGGSGRSFSLHSLQNRPDELTVLRVRRPFPVPASTSTAAPPHERDHMAVLGQWDDAGGVRPVLEQSAVVVG